MIMFWSAGYHPHIYMFRQVRVVSANQHSSSTRGVLNRGRKRSFSGSIFHGDSDFEDLSTPKAHLDPVLGNCTFQENTPFTQAPRHVLFACSKGHVIIERLVRAEQDEVLRSRQLTMKGGKDVRFAGVWACSRPRLIHRFGRLAWASVEHH